MKLKIHDDFLPASSQQILWRYCQTAAYTVGERDTPETPATGIVHELPGEHMIGKLLLGPLQKLKELEGLRCYRAYINCFIPREQPYWHQDGQGITALYYPNLITPELDEGGETQLLIDEDILGIRPIANRLALFDGSAHHRATSFRTQHRYTIAIKFK